MCDVTVINSRILRNKNKIGNSKQKSKTLGNSMNFNMNVKAPLFAWETGPSLHNKLIIRNSVKFSYNYELKIFFRMINKS